jgi:hypothetical protein
MAQRSEGRYKPADRLRSALIHWLCKQMRAKIMVELLPV